MQALEAAGYDISTQQYNRPPTTEELKKPWMWRFQKPSIMVNGKKIKKSALVWDRGPAGDFVYGNLNDLPSVLKQQRYVDFHRFEEDCMAKGILFCKLLFVTSKDAIAKTLGKRLAHKKIVGDLHTWLDANCTDHSDGEREGLQEIENHIDPSDFVAVNNYDRNKKIFYEFVLHTDRIGRLHSNSTHIMCDSHHSICDDSTNPSCDYFPWLIINTSERHQARIQVMKSFEKQLDQYEKSIRRNAAVVPALSPTGDVALAETNEDSNLLLLDSSGHPIDHEYDCNENQGNLMVALKESFIYLLLMVIIPCTYLHQSWKIGF